MTSEKKLRTSTAKQGTPRNRLLSDSKSTSAALARLEKGIRFVYKKDYKRARNEFESIADSYPSESEIIARSKSYLQICDREELSQTKVSISNDQLYSLGVVEHNRGHYEKAIRYFHDYLEKNPDKDYVHYSVAASQALMADFDEAIKSLHQAIALNEDNRIYAKNDQDFFSLHERKEFSELVGLSPATTPESAQS